MQSFELDKNDIQRIKQALTADDDTLKVLLSEYHASEIAILFESLSQEAREKIINVLPSEIASEVISEMDVETHPEKILDNLDREKRTEIVEEMDYDDAADIISLLSEERQNEILTDMDQEDASSIRTLLTYDEDTAGGLMNTQVLKVNSSLTKKEALEEIIRLSEEIEEFYTINVVDNYNHLVGIVSLKDIIKSKYSVHIRELIKPISYL